MRRFAFGAFAVLVALSGGCFDEGTAVSEVADPAGSESPAAFTAEGWTIQTVDSTSTIGNWISLAADSSSNPAIAYVGNGQLKLARWSGTAWVLQSVTASSSWTVVALSLAFDGAGNPAIAFLTQANSNFDGSLRFAQKSGSSWSVKEVDNKADHFSGCSLAYDGSGKANIAYAHTASGESDGNPGKLHLARQGGSNWTKELIDSNGGGRSISLAFDPAGLPAIAYSVDLDPNLFNYDSVKLARKSGSTWTKQTVESGVSGFGIQASLAFDPTTGHPAISHGLSGFYAGACDKRFVSWNGSAWAGEDVNPPSTDTAPRAGSMAFESDGTPNVAFGLWQQGGPTLTVFGRKVAGAWELETVDIDGGFETSIRMIGTASLAYKSGTELRFAQRIP